MMYGDVGRPPTMGPQTPPGAHPAPERPGTTASQLSAALANSRPDRSSASLRMAGVLLGLRGESGNVGARVAPSERRAYNKVEGWWKGQLALRKPANCP